MSSRHNHIDAVKKELAAMKEVGVLDERRYAAALRYVAVNEEEVSDMCLYSSVSDVADSVASIAGSCANGRCE